MFDNEPQHKFMIKIQQIKPSSGETRLIGLSRIKNAFLSMLLVKLS